MAKKQLVSIARCLYFNQMLVSNDINDIFANVILISAMKTKSTYGSYFVN